MYLQWRVQFWILMLIFFINSSFGSTDHTYPKSGGLSGNDGYPSSGGLSGNNSGYQLSGVSYRYPTSGSSNRYPFSGSNYGYPYPEGRYNSTRSRYNSVEVPSPLPENLEKITYTTNAHNKYIYTPPKRITYTPLVDGPPIYYPVYQNPPPGYVYEILDSGSKYGTLITGLALMNLGALANRVYNHVPNNSHYKNNPGEICLFGVKKDNGDYEEFRIDCTFMSTFLIYAISVPNIVTATTASNKTTFSTMNGIPGEVSPLSPVYGDVLGENMTSGNSTSSNNTTTSSVTPTITQSYVINALDVKGDPIEVTNSMNCYIISVTPISRMRKRLSCTLLQLYADSYIQKNHGNS